MNDILVTADLLDVLDRKQNAEAALERQLVTAFVLGGGGSVRSWAKPVTLCAAQQIWPPAMYRKPARNVLTILLELERLGVIAGLEPAEGGFVVRMKKEAAA